MNLYALALSATRKDETYIIPAHATAISTAEARGLGVEEAARRFPISEGFANHVAIAGLIDDEHIKAAGWVKKSTAKRVRKPRRCD